MRNYLLQDKIRPTHTAAAVKLTPTQISTEVKTIQLLVNHLTMRYLIFSLLCFSNPIQAQLLSAIVDVLNPIYEAFSDPDYNNRFQQPPPPGQFPGGRFDGGTPEPVATGRDELFPSDCGRHPHDGTGKLCFPDGLLCRNRKFAMWFLVKLGR
mgnify:FL=1